MQSPCSNTSSSGALPHDRYIKIRDLARGGFGSVSLCRDRITGEEVAIKYIPRGPEVTKYVESEILVMRRLNHYHTIKFKGVVLTPDSLGIVMEYASGGSLFSLVNATQQGLDENLARWFFQQLIIALDYCHRLNIMHRDIKLENMLLQGSGRNALLKLCDFGYSKDETRYSIANSYVGTLYYNAPEMLVNVQQKPYDARAADMWSCGVALYAMLTKRYPYQVDANTNAIQRSYMLVQRIAFDDIDMPDSLSAECCDLLSRLLAKDPCQRISIAEVQAHPWYKRHLPVGVANMNMLDNLYEVPSHTHSEADIKAIVAEARTLPASAASHAPFLHAMPLEEDDNSYSTVLLNTAIAMEHAQRNVASAIAPHGGSAGARHSPDHAQAAAAAAPTLADQLHASLLHNGAPLLELLGGMAGSGCSLPPALLQALGQQQEQQAAAQGQAGKLYGAVDMAWQQPAPAPSELTSTGKTPAHVARQQAQELKAWVQQTINGYSKVVPQP